jgi:hypothetical protein
MRRYPLILCASILLIAASAYALAAENATVTEGGIPFKKDPSFISDEVGTTVKGERVLVLSRTSFTDRLAAVPDDYWYLVRTTRAGAPPTGYVHGSILAIDPGTTVSVFDPPGFTPTAPPPGGKLYTVRSSVNAACRKTNGTLTIPKGKVATHFTIVRFDSSFTSCPGGGYGSIIGFSIVPSAKPADELFTYEEHIADDPAELQYTKDGFYYFDLEPGNYTVTIQGGPDTTLELTYELTDKE